MFNWEKKQNRFVITTLLCTLQAKLNGISMLEVIIGCLSHCLLSHCKCFKQNVTMGKVNFKLSIRKITIHAQFHMVQTKTNDKPT